MSDRPGEMDERDVDERFASIVAGWDLSDDGDPDAAGPVGPPSSEPPSSPRPASDATPAASDTSTPGGPTTAGRPPWVNPSPLDGLVPSSSWRVVQPSMPPSGAAGTSASAPDEDDEDDEHFEPPPVELPPQEDLHFWGAVLGLVAGPLCLVYVAMARPFHSTRWFLAGLALSLGGFALLVLRQPRHRDDEDDGVRL
ncbi:hypothetical protein [Nostocoides sp. Soil756]|uniref:hypothetical protein n=1 Tax=Nostocoides sp. Soil756 TaxID=1736399 RepID=UPI0006FD3009|nr:hypothetical protein [Tetrasphaera sp. Soil756]KRE63021.1 hypothetical protein ASG78_08755 [Tetrasphaera sp. Soil756]